MVEENCPQTSFSTPTPVREGRFARYQPGPGPLTFTDEHDVNTWQMRQDNGEQYCVILYRCGNENINGKMMCWLGTVIIGDPVGGSCKHRDFSMLSLMCREFRTITVPSI